MLRKFASN